MVTKQPNETTGGSSSFCEMIIFRNESHGELKEFVWEYLRELLRIQNTVKFSIKIPHLTYTVHRLLSDRLLC